MKRKKRDMNGPFMNPLGFLMFRNECGELIAQDKLGKQYSKDEYIKLLNSEVNKINKLEKLYHREQSEATVKEYLVQKGVTISTNRSLLLEELVCLEYADNDERFLDDLHTGRL